MERYVRKVEQAIVKHIAAYREQYASWSYLDDLFGTKRISGEVHEAFELLKKLERYEGLSPDEVERINNEIDKVEECKKILTNMKSLPMFVPIKRESGSNEMELNRLLDPNIILKGVNTRLVPGVVDVLRAASAQQLLDRAKFIVDQERLDRRSVRKIFAYLAKGAKITSDQIVKIYRAEKFTASSNKKSIRTIINRDARACENEFFTLLQKNGAENIS